MGNLSMDFAINLSDLIIREDGYAAIACSFNQSILVQLIVQDKMGRTVLDEKYQMNEDTHEILFQVSNFKTGNYHAWFYIEDKIIVKSFHVFEENNGGFFKRIVSKFR